MRMKEFRPCPYRAVRRRCRPDRSLPEEADRRGFRRTQDWRASLPVLGNVPQQSRGRGNRTLAPGNRQRGQPSEWMKSQGRSRHPRSVRLLSASPPPRPAPVSSCAAAMPHSRGGRPCRCRRSSWPVWKAPTAPSWPAYCDTMASNNSCMQVGSPSCVNGAAGFGYTRLVKEIEDERIELIGLPSRSRTIGRWLIMSSYARRRDVILAK